MKMMIEAVIIQDDGSTYRKELLELESSLNQPLLPGLSIDKSKALLKSTQQTLVDAQSQSYMQRHRCCPECGKKRRIKDYQHRKFNTLFGHVPITGYRLYRCSCEDSPFQTVSLLSEWLPSNVHPELKCLETKWASLMSYGLTVERLKDILPINQKLNAVTVRNHLIDVARRQESELESQSDSLDGYPVDWENLPKPGKPMVIGFDGGYVRDSTNRKSNFEVITGKSFSTQVKAKRFGYVQKIEANPRKRMIALLTSQGMQANQQITFLSDGAENLREMQYRLYPEAEHVLDWFHITMKLTVLNQYAKGVSNSSPKEGLEMQEQLESAKWYLWHGNTPEAISQLDICLDICDLPEFKYPKRNKLVQYIEEFIVYLKNNQSMIPNYGERYRYNEPISTSFVESTVNEVVSKRMAKKQQMQWSQQGAHYLLQTRTTVLNGELEAVFEGWYPELKAA